MSLQPPMRVGVIAKRLTLGVSLLATALLTSACSSEEVKHLLLLNMPTPASAEATHIHTLWTYAWVAAYTVGAIVWGLIFYAMWRFRNRNDGRIPVQTRYNLPLEIFYTIAPVLMVVVFFYWTVTVQNQVTKVDANPDYKMDVVGQQWSWTFNYTGQGEGGTTPYTAGTASKIPELVLPVDKTTQFALHSPDVIHSFGIPAFQQKLDVIPGRVNHLQVTPTEIGTYAGKCYELCGVSHSRMLFNVRVVSQAEYDAYLADLQAQGWVADQPLLGGARANTPPGLDQNSDEGASE